jgi:hypothetical protein
MSQYSTGLSNVTNGSPTVTGTNTLWLANVTAGDSFTVAGDGVMYDVASVDSDTQVTLSAPYAGTTASGVVYAIGTGFTVPDSFPEMSQGDIETATIFTRAMRKIQGKISSILAGGASANFTAMPQVGGDPIVESGSNADGEWTRWSDGTQICTWEFTMSITGVSINDTDWDFPAAFNARPSVNWSPQKSNIYFIGGADSRIRSRTVTGHLDNSNTDVTLRMYTIEGLTIPSGGAIERNLVTASGRWQ